MNGQSFVVMTNKSNNEQQWNEKCLFRSLIHDEDISNVLIHDEEEEMNDTLSHDGCLAIEDGMEEELFDNVFFFNVTMKLNGKILSCGVSFCDTNQVNQRKDSYIILTTDMIPMSDSISIHQLCLYIPEIILNYSHMKYKCNNLHIVIEMKQANQTIEIQMNCQTECIYSELLPLNNVNITTTNTVNKDGRTLPLLQLRLMQTRLPLSWSVD